MLSALIGRPVPAPDELLERFPELAQVRFRRGGLPPRIGGWMLGTRSVAAITLWRTIWLAPGIGWSPALLLHELRHTHHFQASLSFPLEYVWESLRRGYHNNRFERDADDFAARRLGASASRPSTLDP